MPEPVSGESVRSLPQDLVDAARNEVGTSRKGFFGMLRRGNSSQVSQPGVASVKDAVVPLVPFAENSVDVQPVAEVAPTAPVSSTGETSAQASARITNLMREAGAYSAPPVAEPAVERPERKPGNLLANIGDTLPDEVAAPSFSVAQPATPEPAPITYEQLTKDIPETLPKDPLEGLILGMVSGEKPDYGYEDEISESDLKASDKFIESVKTRDYFSKAVEKITGKIPGKDHIDGAIKAARNKMLKVKSLGQPLPDFIAGAVLGGGSKQIALMSLSIAGVGGLPFTAGVGAAGGAASGAIREYIKQRHTIDIGESAELKGARQKLKNEFARIKLSDKKKLRNAALRGAVAGAVGGVVGGAIVDKISEHVDLSGITNRISEFRHPEPGVKITTISPASAHEAVTAPTPGVAAATETATATVSPTVTEVVPPVAPPVENLITPSAPAAIELPAGSNPWTEVDKYLTQTLNRAPTDMEIVESVGRLLADNEITDPTRIAAGTHLDMTGVGKIAQELMSSNNLIPPDIAVLPETIHLPVGSDPWMEVSSLLKDLGKSPTNEQIMDITKQLCLKSDIAVPAWGIPGSVDSNNLPSGFLLNFDDEVKRKIAGIAA